VWNWPSTCLSIKTSSSFHNHTHSHLAERLCCLHSCIINPDSFTSSDHISTCVTVNVSSNQHHRYHPHLNTISVHKLNGVHLNSSLSSALFISTLTFTRISSTVSIYKRRTVALRGHGRGMDGRTDGRRRAQPQKHTASNCLFVLAQPVAVCLARVTATCSVTPSVRMLWTYIMGR